MSSALDTDGQSRRWRNGDAGKSHAGVPSPDLDAGDDGAHGIAEPSDDSITTGAHRRHRGRIILEIALALAPTVILVGYWATIGRNERMSMLEDDAFYYLGVARSIADGHGSTFAGSIMTNGYHPLWMVLLVPVTAIVQDPDWLVLAVLLLNGLLWAASVREVFRIGRLVGCWQCAAGALAVYAVTTVMTGHLAFNGMESALVLYLFLVLIRVGMSLDDGRTLRSDLKVGILLALICLSRLDAVFGAVPVALVLLMSGRPPRQVLVRRAAAFAVPPAIALATYTAYSTLVFGIPTPVSGRVKALGAPGDNIDQLWGFLKIGKFDGRPLWFGAAGLVMVVLALISRRWQASRPLGRLMGMTLALVVGQAILVAYQVLSTSFTFVFPWYHYQLALFSFGAAVILASWATQRFGSMARVACIGLAGCVVIGAMMEIAVKAGEPKRQAAFIGADFVAEELPGDALVAMGDRAGYFGYLADRPLLHLEGLVADTDLLHEMERGDVPERLRAEGVDYYVHNSRPGRRITVDGDDCWQFVEPPYTFGPKFLVTVCQADLVYRVDDPEGGTTLSIWRYRPELNPGGS